MKIGVIIAGTFLISLALIGLITIPYFQGEFESALSSNAVSLLQNTTESKAAQITAFLGERKNFAIDAASVFEDKMNNNYNETEDSSVLRAELEPSLKQMASNDPYLLKISIINTEGVIVASSDKSEIGLANPEIIESLNTREFYIKDAHISSEPPRPKGRGFLVSPLSQCCLMYI